MTRDELRTFFDEELGWCGCGRPEEALEFMRDVLAAMEERSASRTDGEWDRATRKIESLLGIEEEKERQGLGWSYLYMLDAADLTEHGGGVGGSWLTAKGVAVLSALRDLGDDLDLDKPAPPPAPEGQR